MKIISNYFADHLTATELTKYHFHQIHQFIFLIWFFISLFIFNLNVSESRMFNYFSLSISNMNLFLMFLMFFMQLFNWSTLQASSCLVIGDHSRGRPKGSLFNSYYTEALLLSLDYSTLSLQRTLYCWVLSKEVSSTILWVFGMTWPGTEPKSPGPLENTLHTRPMSRSSCIKIRKNVERISVYREHGITVENVCLTLEIALTYIYK